MVSPRRRASSATTSSPTLWRVRAYSLPGLPSPTINQSNGVERLTPRQRRPTRPLRPRRRFSSFRRLGRGSSATSASSAAISAISARIVSTVTIGISGSPTGVTPAGIGTSSSRMTVSICIVEMSITNSSGMLRGVVTTSIESTAGSTRPPPWLTLMASPSRRSGTDTVISSSRRTWMKSMWATLRRTG